MNRIDLKERIAISDAFTSEERDFLLDAINAMPDDATTIVDAPGNYMGRIEQIWAYLSLDDGGEGVCGFQAAGLGNLPMIAADKRRMDQLRPYAQQLARMTRKPIRFVRFKQREDVEIIQP
jgi:hypothetical protein